MSKEKKKLVPRLRFEEFSKNDEWEKDSLENISKSYSGGTPSVMNSSFYNGTIPFIRSGEIHKDSTKLFISEVALNNSSARMVKKGDILYALYGATSGEVSISKIDGAINQAILAIVPNQKYDSTFLEKQLNKKKEHILNSFLQGGQGNLSGEIIRTLYVTYPIAEEQAEIGSFFSKIDKLIQLQQSKVNKTKDIKSAYLSEMFPKEGEKYPKRRFEGFTEPWKEEYLGNLSNITTGALDANAMNPKGKYDFYTSGMQKYKIDTPAFEGPAITIAGNGATVGYMHLADGSFNAYQRTYVLTQFHAIREFLYLEIGRKLPVKIKQEARMGNIPYIVMDMLVDLTIHLPSLEEQQKIGEFFKNLDTQIAIEEEKLEKLEQLKQAYLNDMFV